MRWLVLVLIVFAKAPRAGEIFTPVCSGCGYEGGEVWAGNGPGGGYDQLMSVYFCPADRTYYTAVFDPTAMFAFKSGLVTGSGWEARLAFQAAHEPSLSRFLGAWHPPEAISPPAGVGSFFRDGALPGGRLRLVADPWNGLHPCPACGRRTISFVETGMWD